MTQSIITYYIPQNLNITKGKIYNLYINKVKNLDLTSIITPIQQTISNTPKTITITEDTYNNIFNLINNQEKIYNQSKEIVKQLTKERK
ncbi:MAG: hypothetical protein IJI49_04265 [Bacilli bacterium]|nr:hypothetical protein [Bacilli bacterium]